MVMWLILLGLLDHFVFTLHFQRSLLKVYFYFKAYSFILFLLLFIIIFLFLFIFLIYFFFYFFLFFYSHKKGTRDTVLVPTINAGLKFLSNGLENLWYQQQMDRISLSLPPSSTVSLSAFLSLPSHAVRTYVCDWRGMGKGEMAVVVAVVVVLVALLLFLF